MWINLLTFYLLILERNDANHNISETEDTTTNVNNEPQDYIIEVFKEPNSKSLRISTKLIFKGNSSSGFFFNVADFNIYLFIIIYNLYRWVNVFTVGNA